MKRIGQCNTVRHLWRFPAIIALLSGLNLAAHVRASETLVYSFEDGLDGFAMNGGFVTDTVSQDTIGATDGTHSLKISAPVGPGFFGALTSTLPAAIGDPPGIDYIAFDMTVTSPFGPGGDVPGFAVVGVTMFGKTQADPTGAGLQAQFDDQEHIDGKAAGTYSVRIDLNSAAHPLTGDYPQTFDQIFGTLGSGPNDLIPSGFELFFNKTVGADYPLTVYIDNIRAGINPLPLPGDYNSDGKVNAADYVTWRENVGQDSIDNRGDGITGTVGIADYNFWRSQYGNASPGSGSSFSSGSVPEPGSGLLLVFALAYGLTRRARSGAL